MGAIITPNPEMAPGKGDVWGFGGSIRAPRTDREVARTRTRPPADEVPAPVGPVADSRGEAGGREGPGSGTGVEIQKRGEARGQEGPGFGTGMEFQKRGEAS